MCGEHPQSEAALVQMWGPSAHQGNPKLLPGTTHMALSLKKTLTVHLDVERTQRFSKGLEADTCLPVRVCKATGENVTLDLFLPPGTHQGVCFLVSGIDN